MNDVARSRPMVLVLLAGLILATALATTGSVAASGDPSNEQLVVITLDMSDPAHPTINPPGKDPVVLSRSRGHWAHWRLSYQGNATLSIVMKNGPAPFASQPDCHGKECTTDPPVAQPGSSVYPYKIAVTIAGGPSVPPLDPGIRVDP